MSNPVVVPMNPRPTVGHHFGALLQCPQQAWFEYHGDPTAKMPSPPYLVALQREGIEHERSVCSTTYPHGVRIPDRIPPDERLAKTLQALRAGAPAILQAYLRTTEGLGIADVLELVSRSVAVGEPHLYQIGEFKRTTSLKTAHVLQAMWYRELLGSAYGRANPDVFLILGDGGRTVVATAGVEEVYRQCKGDLRQLRNASMGPGPHLSRGCLSCPWRGICMPVLRDSRHLSLVPGITRRHVLQLRDAGVTAWSDLPGTSDSDLARLGLDAPEVRKLRRAILQLTAGKVVCRVGVKPSIATLTPVSFDYNPVQDGNVSSLKPHMLWYESERGPESIPLENESGQEPHADLSPLVHRSGLAVYGGLDMATLLRLVRGRTFEQPLCVDVLDLVADIVHVPVLGLELEQVVHFVTPATAPVTTASQRVSAIRTVVNWLVSGETAA